jgi:hypothetical protein
VVLDVCHKWTVPVHSDFTLRPGRALFDLFRRCPPAAVCAVWVPVSVHVHARRTYRVLSLVLLVEVVHVLLKFGEHCFEISVRRPDLKLQVLLDCREFCFH